LFKHLETDCENFEKGKQIYKNIDSKQKQQISQLNFNAIFTPVTETPDPSFESKEFQDQPNLNLVSSSKNKGETKKLQFIKEIQIPGLALGQIHLKSNQFCVFGHYVKNRFVRQYAAYRVEDNNVQVVDITTNQECAVLSGHTDLVTEIRYFKSKKDYNLLFTCSYDGYVFIWDISTFTKIRSINFKTWTLSVVIAPHFENELIFVCGGYSKASPIKERLFQLF
jgi:WD40 repeat protein